jgi:hypothetical protein
LGEGVGVVLTGKAVFLVGRMVVMCWVFWIGLDGRSRKTYIDLDGYEDWNDAIWE